MNNTSSDKSTSIASHIKDMSFIRLKIQKIVSAIYLVTGLISDNEPIRQEIRRVALSFMSLCARGNTGNDFYAAGNELVALLRIGSDAGIVSVMNQEVLVSEIEKLIQENKHKYSLEQDFFAVRQPLSELAPAPASISQGQDKGHSKGQDNSVKNVPNMSFKDTPNKPAIKDTIKRTYGDSDLKREKRRRDIIQIVKRKREVMIKDISLLMNNYSEKTIQRELIHMVEEGLLKKEGDRRWSKYSLPKV